MKRPRLRSINVLLATAIIGILTGIAITTLSSHLADKQVHQNAIKTLSVIAVEGRTTIPVENHRGAWVAQAELNGVPGKFLIDTGSIAVIISPKFALKAKVIPSGQELELQSIQSRMKAPVAQINSIKVGAIQSNNVTAIIIGSLYSDIDGILGNSFLNSYITTIDPQQKLLHLVSISTKQTP